MPDTVHVILDGVLKPIDLLVDNGFNRAALVLLYSGMDVMAFMSMPAGKNSVTQRDYTNWAGKYIHFSCKEQVTGLEPYAARCGVLHTFTPDSNLSREGEVRRIVYVNHHTPEVKYDPTLPENIVLVSIHGLYRAFIAGVQQFFGELCTDKARETQALERLNAMFLEVPQ